MKELLIRTAATFAVCLWLPAAIANEPFDSDVETILAELKGSASQGDFEQIKDAIAASEILRRSIKELAAANRFTGFSIAPRAQIRDGRSGIFGGFTKGTKIVLAAEYLKDLKKVRQFDHVYPADISPNNTVFVLAHLLHHIRTPIVPQNYSSPESFSKAVLQIEAAAFIHAWNAMLQVAVLNNGDKPITGSQQGQLLMNTRYRFAFIGAMDQKIDPLKFTLTGELEANERNIQAIATTLKNSRVADIE